MVYLIIFLFNQAIHEFLNHFCIVKPCHKDLCIKKYQHFGIELPSYYYQQAPQQMQLFDQEKEVSWMWLVSVLEAGAKD